MLKKTAIISLLSVLMLGLLSTSVFAGVDNDFFNTEYRINRIGNSVHFAHNIIVGTPIEKIQGEVGVLPFSEEGCMVMFTDYYFKVINWAFGERGEDIIRVRSQVGNVFEIGNAYTFAARRINSIFFDQYNVNSHSWFVRNEDVPEADLIILLGNVGRMRAIPFIQPLIINYATPCEYFVSNVDVAVIATIEFLIRDELKYINFDAMLDVNEVVHGYTDKRVFDEFTRLRGDAVVGNSYLILFTQDEYGHLTLAARSGAVVPYGNAEFYEFMKLL